MPDTERTESELLSIFQSLKPGGITAQDMRDFVKSVHPDTIQNWINNGFPQGAQGFQGVQGAQAGYGLANQAAQNFANIGTAQQQADISRLGLQNQMGTLQQQQEQNIINQAIQNYAMAQNYPQQQLAGYNALLRGYATPTTTTQSYQAINPVAQLGGLGLAAYGLSRKAGGPIKEKKFSTGGISSLEHKVLNRPEMFSAEMIDRGIKSKIINPMIGAIALEEVKNKPKAPAKAPQGTILGDLMGSAGIDQLPTNLPTVNAAQGGIIAFGDPKLNPNEDQQVEDTSRFSKWWSDITAPTERYKEYAERNKQYQDLLQAYRAQPGLFEKTSPKALSAAEERINTAAEVFKKPVEDKKDEVNKSDITIHDGKTDKEAKSNAPAPALSPMSAKTVTDADYGGIASMLKEYGDMIKGAYQDPEKAREDAKSAMYVGLGTRLMASKNPNLLGALGEAGMGTAEDYQKSLNQIEANKRAQVGQLVSLGLKGAELKQELKKLGITEDYYLKHGKYFEAMANAAGNKGGAKLGSIPFSELRKVNAEYEGYLADPKSILSSPFARLIPPATDEKYGYIRKGLAAKPGSPSYNNAIEGARKFAEAHKQELLNQGMLYGSRGNPLAGLLDQ